MIIKKHGSGKWFACICVEQTIQAKKKEGRKAIGIDVGIKHFLTDSEGRKIENPKFYQRTLQRIKIVQHWLSKKRKGSKNREKQRVKLVKRYERLVNQRDDYLHKLSRFYVNNYDVIAVEDLNIRGMVRNHNLAGKILDASWSKFLQMLSYKAENAGGVVIKINPRGTSKEGDKNLDRDYRAALNILMRGWGSPKTLAEMRPLLVNVPASLIVEAGSPQALAVGSSPTFVSRQ